VQSISPDAVGDPDGGNGEATYYRAMVCAERSTLKAAAGRPCHQANATSVRNKPTADTSRADSCRMDEAAAAPRSTKAAFCCVVVSNSTSVSAMARTLVLCWLLASEIFFTKPSSRSTSPTTC